MCVCAVFTAPGSFFLASLFWVTIQQVALVTIQQVKSCKKQEQPSPTRGVLLFLEIYLLIDCSPGKPLASWAQIANEQARGDMLINTVGFCVSSKVFVAGTIMSE